MQLCTTESKVGEPINPQEESPNVVPGFGIRDGWFVDVAPPHRSAIGLRLCKLFTLLQQETCTDPNANGEFTLLQENATASAAA